MKERMMVWACRFTAPGRVHKLLQIVVGNSENRSVIKNDTEPGKQSVLLKQFLCTLNIFACKNKILKNY